MSSALPARLIKGLNADYEPAIWPGDNTSGLTPYGHYVLVKMDACSTSSMGGIVLTDEMVERMNEAAETGCIYAIGEGAFARFDDGRPWVGEKPQAGDRVYVEKYAGVKAMGRDGGLYRIMSESCIAAGLVASEERA